MAPDDENQPKPMQRLNMGVRERDEELMAWYPVLQFFEYEHLPPFLRDTSKLFARNAYYMADMMPRSAEVAVGLRKLLEAKDAFVRAHVAAKKTPPPSKDD